MKNGKEEKTLDALMAEIEYYSLYGMYQMEAEATIPRHKEACSSCRFHDPFTGTCGNGASDHYAGYMPSYTVCNEYTAIEEEDEYEFSPNK